MNASEGENKRQQHALLVTLWLLLSAALACNLSLSGPQPPIPAVAISDAAAQALADTLASITREPAPGESFEVALDEAGLTSWVALRESGWPLERVQITVGGDAIQLYGERAVGGFSSGVLLEIRPTLSPAGELDLTLAAAHFGPERLPAETLERLVANLRGVMVGPLDTAPLPYRLEMLRLAQGTLTLGGVWLAAP